MQNFHYTGRDKAGTAVKGKRSAQSAEVIASQLFQEGITPIEITEIKPSKNFSSWLRTPLYSKVSLSDLMLFCRQMYSLTKAGIPIIQAVNRLAETTRNHLLSVTLRDVVERISAGEDLASALKHHSKIFSMLFVNVIRVGEHSGHLEQSFAQLADYLTLEEKTIRRVKAAVRYPSFVVIALLIAVLVFNLLVIPAFARLFSSFEQELPLATRMLIASSNFMLNHWLELLGGTIFVILSVRYYLKTPGGRLQWHKWIRKLPIVGAIIAKIHSIRFAHIFAMVFQAGIPIGDGLPLVAGAIGNVYVRDRIFDMHHYIQRGEGLTQAASHCQLFSPLALQMISVGEETGHLDTMMREVADFYEREVDYDLDRLSDAIEPILLVGIGVMVLVLALGVFLPMWDVARLVRGG